MKNRILILAVVIAVFAAFSITPHAEAEPLTVIAVVGIVTVLTASSIDIITGHSDESKDMRADQDATDRMVVAKVDIPPETSGATEAAVSGQP